MNFLLFGSGDRPDYELCSLHLFDCDYASDSNDRSGCIGYGTPVYPVKSDAPCAAVNVYLLDDHGVFPYIKLGIRGYMALLPPLFEVRNAQ